MSKRKKFLIVLVSLFWLSFLFEVIVAQTWQPDGTLENCGDILGRACNSGDDTCPGAGSPNGNACGTPNAFCIYVQPGNAWYEGFQCLW